MQASEKLEPNQLFPPFALSEEQNHTYTKEVDDAIKLALKVGDFNISGILEIDIPK